MRHRFQQQTTLGITPVSEVKFQLRSRDELPPVLKRAEVSWQENRDERCCHCPGSCPHEPALRCVA